MSENQILFVIGYFVVREDVCHPLSNLKIELVLEDGVAVQHGLLGLPVGPVPDVGVGDEVREGGEVSHVQVEDWGATEVPALYCSTVLPCTAALYKLYSAHCILYTAVHCQL